MAIRNGYLNFYRAGQSVAKVGFDDRKNLQAKIHNKFVDGEQRSGQTYVTLNMTGLCNKKTGVRRKYNGLDDLRRWISNANQYTGEEKQFVDRIVARNPNVVDLEMALPAYSKKRTAPRMDLVALEKVSNRWRVVFWEAKLVADGRARCLGEDQPRVIQQLQDYTDWLDHENTRAL